MEYQEAKNWLYQQLGYMPAAGVTTGNIVDEVRENLNRQLLVGSPREHTAAAIKLHELDYHVCPAVRTLVVVAPVPLSRQQDETET